VAFKEGKGNMNARYVTLLLQWYSRNNDYERQI